MKGFSWVLGLAFLVVDGWLIIKTIRQKSDLAITGKHSALELLKERYVRGEINQDEFREKKSEIQI